MKNEERDILRKIILGLIIKGHTHYTDIEKKAVSTCINFVTSNTFRKQFYDYLVAKGYIRRVSRGVYAVTERGQKLLEILS